MQKKKYWAGVVSGEIRFFSEDPQGNVQGLQGSRPFTVTGNCELKDEAGSNLIHSTQADVGTDAPQSGITNQQQSQSGGQQTA